MEYVLNKLDKKTTNGFGINDIKLDLDLKQNEFENYKVKGKELSKINIIKSEKSIESKIGLSFNKALSVDINVPDYTNIKDPVIFEFDFDERSNLVLEFNINYGISSSLDLIILFKSINNKEHFNFFKENLINNDNSTGNIAIINMLNEKSNNFFSVENKVLENSYIKHNIIDIGAKKKISNIYSLLEKYNSKNELNAIYIGTNEDIIDINYNSKNCEKKTESNIVLEGVLDNNAKKNFRGIIDFEKNSKKSIGNEIENCVILDENSKSKSLPMLLCHEDDVIGSHGVSCGKVDENKIFYLMNRGLTKKEAELFIIKSNFNKILKNINDEKIVDEINIYIDKKIK